MDESQVVGGYDNGDIRRWKIQDGQQWGSIMKTGNKVNSVVVSQDGRWVVSGDREKVVVWNAVTHKKVLEFSEHGGNVWAVDISSDSTRIASVDGKNGNSVEIRNTSGDRLLPLTHIITLRLSSSPRTAVDSLPPRWILVSVSTTHTMAVFCSLQVVRVQTMQNCCTIRWLGHLVASNSSSPTQEKLFV